MTDELEQWKARALKAEAKVQELELLVKIGDPEIFDEVTAEIMEAARDTWRERAETAEAELAKLRNLKSLVDASNAIKEAFFTIPRRLVAGKGTRKP